MPSLRVSCFCADGSKSDINWCSLPVCGHIFHLSCAQKWFASRLELELPAECPNCRKDTDAVFMKTGKKGRGKALLRLIPLFVEDISSDPATQASPDSHLRNTPLKHKQVGSIAEEHSALEESESEEETDPFQKLQKDNRVLQRRHNDLVASQRQAMNKLQVVKDALETQKREIYEISEERDELVSENQNLQEVTTEQKLEITSLKEEIEQLSTGQPNLRLNITELEENLLELQDVVGVATAEAAQLKEEFAIKEKEWKVQEKKLLKEKQRIQLKLDQEGNAGAMRNAQLTNEIESLNTSALVYKKKSAIAYNSITQELADLTATLDQRVAEQQDKVHSAEIAVEIANSQRLTAETKMRHLEQANKNWEEKYLKLKAKKVEKVERLPRRQTVVLSSPEFDDPRERHPPARQPSPFEEVPLYRINNSALIPKVRKHAFDMEEEDEVEERKSRGDVSPKKPRITTLIAPERIPLWNRPIKTMREESSDKHIPAFGLAAGPKFGPKFRGTKGERGL